MQDCENRNYHSKILSLHMSPTCSTCLVKAELEPSSVGTCSSLILFCFSAKYVNKVNLSSIQLKIGLTSKQLRLG